MSNFDLYRERVDSKWRAAIVAIAKGDPKKAAVERASIDLLRFDGVATAEYRALLERQRLAQDSILAMVKGVDPCFMPPLQ